MSAVITESLLPSNHHGNITVHVVGTGTVYSVLTTFTASGVAGWAVVSVVVVDTEHATVVLSCPAIATPPSGPTGTLTLTEGVTGTDAATTTVDTPTLAIAPSSGNIGSTPTLALTGANTLWASETAAGLFTVTGGVGASIGTPVVADDTDATDVLTVGSSTSALTIKDTSTGAVATFTPTQIAKIGTTEYGAGTAASISVASGLVIIGPWQTVDRLQMELKVHARGTLAFDLNYEFSTDQGTTWYVGEQVAASSVSADDGASYPKQAHGHFNVGYWWRISVYNKDATTPLDIAFEWRFHEF